MMSLSLEQKDVFRELVNVGFGRAANALSDLVGRRIALEAPELDVYPLQEMEQIIDALNDPSLLTVHQVFSGRLCGDTLLLFEAGSAGRLVSLLNKGPSPNGTAHEGQLDPRALDTLTEVGNILLSAFTGSFGNLLRIHVTFTVPTLHKSSILHLIESLRVEEKDVQYAVVVRVFFRLVDEDINSHLIIIMGIDSLDALIGAMHEVGYLSG
jgi:chemotaxis protein CheC